MQAAEELENLYERKLAAESARYKKDRSDALVIELVRYQECNSS